MRQGLKMNAPREGQGVQRIVARRQVSTATPRLARMWSGANVAVDPPGGSAAGPFATLCEDLGNHKFPSWLVMVNVPKAKRLRREDKNKPANLVSNSSSEHQELFVFAYRLPDIAVGVDHSAPWIAITTRAVWNCNARR